MNETKVGMSANVSRNNTADVKNIRTCVKCMQNVKLTDLAKKLARLKEENTAPGCLECYR